MRPNTEYSLLERQGLAARLMNYQRRRIYERFLAETGIGEADTLLDVGASDEEAYESSNPIEAWYPHLDKVTAIGLGDGKALTRAHPGLTYVQGDGRDLPFPDKSFDIVHSSAVLEHVGSAENQMRFIQEAARVARKAFFLTTPNRWFPVELHTALPFAHWLPKAVFRGLLRGIGQTDLAEEANLNLVGARGLSVLLRNAGPEIERFDVRISAVDLGGWPANLLLVGRLKRD